MLLRREAGGPAELGAQVGRAAEADPVGGSGLLADDDLRLGYAGEYCYGEAALAALAVLDPVRTARADVDKLLASPQLSPSVAVSGYAYDLKTGLLTQVAAPCTRTGRTAGA